MKAIKLSKKVIKMSTTYKEETVETNMEDIEWCNSDDAKIEYTTRKFSETTPGVYHVTPLRRIHTRHGNQLICRLVSGENSFETFVPNSFVTRLISTCGTVEHTCMLKYNGYKNASTTSNNAIPIYDFAIGKIKGNPSVVLARPVQESQW